MITVSKKNLAADLNGYFRRVEHDGEELIVTENSVPVLRVVPIGQPNAPSIDDLFGDLRGKVRIVGDLTEPTSGEWKDL